MLDEVHRVGMELDDLVRRDRAHVVAALPERQQVPAINALHRDAGTDSERKTVVARLGEVDVLIGGRRVHDQQVLHAFVDAVAVLASVPLAFTGNVPDPDRRIVVDGLVRKGRPAGRVILESAVRDKVHAGEAEPQVVDHAYARVDGGQGERHVFRLCEGKPLGPDDLVEGDASRGDGPEVHDGAVGARQRRLQGEGAPVGG